MTQLHDNHGERDIPEGTFVQLHPQVREHRPEGAGYLWIVGPKARANDTGDELVSCYHCTCVATGIADLWWSGWLGEPEAHDHD